MKKILERLALFFIGLPLILASVVFLPYKNFLVLHIEIIFFSALAILEIRSLVSNKLKVHKVFVNVFLGLCVPIVYISSLFFDFSDEILGYTFTLVIISIFSLEFLLSFSGNFNDSVERIASTLVTTFYPGFLALYIAKITMWKDAGIIIILFLSMVFGCDSLAWFFGVLFGKNNRGIVKASPNKSIAGFIGGYIGSIIVSLLFYYWFVEIFTVPVYKIIILAFLVATFAIVGDVIESIIKRSVNIKDSGFIIPGRGGLLDSIDSIIISAPIYYLAYDVLIGFVK